MEHLPRPIFVRVESFPAGTRVKPHRHDWEQVVYVISGVLGISTATGHHLALPQRAIWIPAGVEHAGSTSEGAEMRSLYIDSVSTGLSVPRCTVYQVPPLLRELIRVVSGLPVEYDTTGTEGRLVQVLLDQLAALSEVPFSLPLPQDSRLARVCSGLQHSVDDPRTLGQWAEIAGMSERTLTRVFRRETGLSFRAWRQRLRLLLAVQALESGKSVTTVALDSGYESLSAFIAAFKRQFGKTPGELAHEFSGEKG